ncbi:MAG: AsmA-like C-terminal domain-containing protein [Deltaproteobacteria bacterium]
MKATRWKKVGIIVAVLAVIVIAAALIVPRFFDLNRYNGLITSQIEAATGGEVTLGVLSWGISNGLWLEAGGFALKGSSRFPGAVALSRLYARVSILPLLSKKLVVDKLVLESPVLTVNLASSSDKRKKVETKPHGAPPTGVDTAAPVGKPSSLLPVEILVEELILEKGRISLEHLPGQQVSREFSQVEVEATNLAPGKHMGFRFSLQDESKPGLGSLKGQGTFVGLTKALTLENPKLEVQATLSDLEVETLKPYIKDKSLVERLGGSISLEIEYEGDLGKHFSAEGQMDLTQFTYTDPSKWEKPFPGVKSKITYKLVFDLDQIKVEKFDLTLGGTSIRGEGLLRHWREKPVIENAELSANLPLVELGPLVPWKILGKKEQIIRQALEGGGEVTIDKLVLPELTLVKLPSKAEAFLSKIEGSLRVANVSVAPWVNLPKFEDIKGDLRLEKGELTAAKVQARIGPLTLPPLRGRVTNLTGKLKVSAAAKGPMGLIGTQEADVEKLLKEYGLESLSGSAEVDLQADYDQAKGQKWDASGSLALLSVRAASYPAGARLEDLKGWVKFKLGSGLELTVADLTARLNKAPIKLDGKISGRGKAQLIVDTRAETEGLVLTDLSSLFRPLRELELKGKLDMKVDVHYLGARPAETRLYGKVKASGLGIKLGKFAVTKGNTDIEFEGKRVNLKDVSLLVNDQKINGSGQLSDFQKPTAKFRVESANLNLDRLLPPAAPDEESSKVSSKPPGKEKGKVEPERTPSEKEAKEGELNPFLRKLRAEIEAEVKRGLYRGVEFQNLKFKVMYERGLLKSHDLEFLMGGGHIQSRGSADLRNLKKIPFALQPTIEAVPVELVGPLLGIKKVSLKGPVNLIGQLRGTAGSTLGLLQSLRGNIEAEMGPGRVYKLGRTGNVFFDLLDFLSLSNILSGKSLKDFGSEGVPYKSVKAKTSLQDGKLNFSQLILESPALGLHAHGDIDLVKKLLNMRTDIEIFGTLDKILGLVPIVGEASTKLTKVYVTLEGDVDKPKIAINPAEGLAKAGKKEVREGEKGTKEVIKELSKGLEKILRK